MLIQSSYLQKKILGAKKLRACILLKFEWGVYKYIPYLVDFE